MIYFKSRPLGFEVNFREVPFRITRVWRQDLHYLGLVAGMTIHTFDGYQPTKEAVEQADPPFIIHFANPLAMDTPPMVEPSKPFTFQPRESPVEKLETIDENDTTEEKVGPEVITRTITTPDREEPEVISEDIPNADTVPLHPKLDLEKFTTRELGKLYGRAYGQYLEQQVLPWSKETDTAKERLKILMGRIRVLLEKYSVVLEKEIKQKREGTIDSEKLEMSLQNQSKAEEVDREREQTKSVGDVEDIVTTENSE